MANLNPRFEVSYFGGGRFDTRAERYTANAPLEVFAEPKTDVLVKDDLPLWSPAIFKDDSAAKGGEIERISAITYDLDHVKPEAVGPVLAALKNFFIVHTTWSCTHEDFCARLIFPLRRPLTGPVDRKTWREVWTAARAYLGLEGIVDPACKDPNRRYYVPAQNPDGPEYGVHSGGGDWLDLGDLPAPEPAKSATKRAGSGVPFSLEQLRAWAKRLSRSTTPRKVELCRVLRAGIRGEPLAEPGQRDRTLFALACALRTNFPDADGATLAAPFGPSIAAMQDAAEDAPDFDAFVEKCSRVEPGGDDGSEPGSPHALGLQVNDHGFAKPTGANLARIFANHPDWEGVLAYNELDQCAVALRTPPDNDGAAVGKWTDTDTIRAQHWLTETFDFDPPRAAVDGAIQRVAEQNRFNPVADYLSNLEWDGVSRIDRWLIDYLGAEDNDYTRAVSRCFMLGAVARGLCPGSKVDTALILEGPQGKKKSSALRALVPDVDMFSDTHIDFRNKDGVQVLLGKWLYEIQELHAFRYSDAETVKAFISSQVDNIRPSYGKRNQDFPRRCVFVGSTNDEHYLKDWTGNRRFWPVRCGRIRAEALGEVRDQLWAEAVSLVRQAPFLDGLVPDGPWQWWLTDSETTIAEAEQSERLEVDLWELDVKKFLNVRAAGASVTINDIAEQALQLPPGARGAGTAARLGRILGAMPDWIRERKRTQKGRNYVYVKSGDSEPSGRASPAANARRQVFAERLPPHPSNVRAKPDRILQNTWVVDWSRARSFRADALRTGSDAPVPDPRSCDGGQRATDDRTTARPLDRRSNLAPDVSRDHDSSGSGVDRGALSRAVGVFRSSGSGDLDSHGAGFGECFPAFRGWRVSNIAN